MKIKLLYFGQAMEIAKLSEEMIELSEGIALSQLKELILQKYPDLGALSLKWAVNQKIESDDFLIEASSEIAVLPPFAGG